MFLLRLLSGPAAFALSAAVPLGLSYEGRIALATFVCVIVWWMTQPMPWAVAAMLPFLVFPAAGVMNIADTMRLYGQPIFFWILGTASIVGARAWRSFRRGRLRDETTSAPLLARENTGTLSPLS